MWDCFMENGKKKKKPKWKCYDLKKNLNLVVFIRMLWLEEECQTCDTFGFPLLLS